MRSDSDFLLRRWLLFYFGLYNGMVPMNDYHTIGVPGLGRYDLWEYKEMFTLIPKNKKIKGVIKTK